MLDAVNQAGQSNVVMGKQVPRTRSHGRAVECKRPDVVRCKLFRLFNAASSRAREIPSVCRLRMSSTRHPPAQCCGSRMQVFLESTGLHLHAPRFDIGCRAGTQEHFA